ncbi:MAG: hypothetical protein MUC55_04385 [Burkholderiales bacterium]|nr:hypothetical protein [Burkholderiales bacterium]
MSKARKESPQYLLLQAKRGESKARAAARELTGPEARAALSLSRVGAGIKDANWDVTALLEELRGQSRAVNGGDLSRAEATLATQGNLLDALFHALLRRSLTNMEAGYTDAAERYMRLGLKAQSQCRTTLETLAAIKNPPVVYARQANVTTGPQQVNNGVPSRAWETEIKQSKLSGNENELLPDTRASAFAGRTDPRMEALGEIDRAEDAGG